MGGSSVSTSLERLDSILYLANGLSIMDIGFSDDLNLRLPEELEGLEVILVQLYGFRAIRYRLKPVFQLSEANCTV